jgi:hypothetical protein
MGFNVDKSRPLSGYNMANYATASRNFINKVMNINYQPRHLEI